MFILGGKGVPAQRVPGSNWGGVGAAQCVKAQRGATCGVCLQRRVRENAAWLPRASRAPSAQRPRRSPRSAVVGPA